MRETDQDQARLARAGRVFSCASAVSSGVTEKRTIPCPGCGLAVPDIDAPTHAYIGAAPGCWEIYGRVLAREYGELRNPPFHRLTVDAYAAQHPGTESRRSTQSVAGHLIALHLVFEQGLAPEVVTKLMPAIVSKAESFRWLMPPSFVGTFTVESVANAKSAEDHERAARRWAESVWRAWGEHHETVRGWAGAHTLR